MHRPGSTSDTVNRVGYQVLLIMVLKDVYGTRNGELPSRKNTLQ